jgi:putative MATE family efflux protein
MQAIPTESNRNDVSAVLSGGTPKAEALLLPESGASPLVRFSLPILSTVILQSVGISINALWIGRYLGAAALAALSNANSLLALLYGVSFGIAGAACIRLGHCIGSGRVTEAKRIVGTSVSIFTLTGLFLGALAGAGANRLALALSVPQPALEMTLSYLQIMFVALVPICVYGFVVAALRAAGDSKTPLYFMVISIVIDAGLNPILIFGIGPVPAFGVRGAALATLVAQMVGLFSLIGYLYARRHFLCIRWRERHLLRIDWSITAALIRNAIPLNAQLAVGAVQQILYIHLVNRYGVELVAAYGASSQIWIYLQMPAYAIAIGVTAFASQFVGAKRWDKVTEVGIVGLACSVVGTMGVVALTDLLGKQAFRLFLNGSDGQLLSAAHINLEVSWSFVFASVYRTVFAVANAKGDVWGPVAITGGVLMATYVITEGALRSYQAEAIWWSFPISAAISALLALLHQKYRRGAIRVASLAENFRG